MWRSKSMSFLKTEPLTCFFGVRATSSEKIESYVQSNCRITVSVTVELRLKLDYWVTVLSRKRSYDMLFWGPRHIFRENWNMCSIKLSHNFFCDSRISVETWLLGDSSFVKTEPLTCFFRVRATSSEKIETYVQSNYRITVSVTVEFRLKLDYWVTVLSRKRSIWHAFLGSAPHLPRKLKHVFNQIVA